MRNHNIHGQRYQRRRRKLYAAILLILFLAASVFALVKGKLLHTPPGNIQVPSLTWTQEIPADLYAEIPPYKGESYCEVNGDVPFFPDINAGKMEAAPFEEYAPLDALGRCTAAYACVGPETLPTEPREDIRSIRPSGWNNARYAGIDKEYLFNRCHLIGYQLTGENANERNLITGTRYLNVEGMLPFENSVGDYIRGTGNHVLYRVTPFYEGNNLIASGVLMEARSIEDPRVQFCVYCYNVQPGITIDYVTGESSGAGRL